MTQNTDNQIPRRLLLATDLSARCDRPLDRARQLAVEWQADVTALVVRQGPDSPDDIADWLDGASTGKDFGLAARAELDAEFAGTNVTLSLQVVPGDVTDAILDAAATLVDGVVVMGGSSGTSFHHLILGSTAGGVAQGLAQPLLVVRQRTRGSYSRILVTTNFGDGSRRALATVARLFPGLPVTLFHAIEDSANEPAGAVLEALAHSERFIAACDLPPGARERIEFMVGHGPVTEAVSRHVAEAQVELVVLGIRRHSAVARVFMGSRSEDLLQRLPCDTLLVRAMESSDDG